MAAEPILATQQLTMRFGGLIAVGDLDLAVAERTSTASSARTAPARPRCSTASRRTSSRPRGEIWFAGERIDGLTPDRVAAAGISRTYQNIRLFRNITAIENLLVGMHLHLRSHLVGRAAATRRTPCATRRAAHEEALQLLQFVGLRGRGDVLARNLAYGEQRRLEIGRALATKPKLLLLDEPTAGMNPRETSDMMEFIQQVRDAFGITIILIEHQMRVVMSMSDRVTVLDHGVKIAEGTPGGGAERSRR